MGTIEKKLKYLSAAADEEIAELRGQLDKTDRAFSNGIAVLDKSLKAQTDDLRDRLQESRTSFDDRLQALKGQLLEEIDRRHASLSSGKVSREDLAEALFELCMQIKGKEGNAKPANAEASRNAELFLPEPD